MANKTRILHVVGRLVRGGAETWLVNQMRAIDRDRFQFDVLVYERDRAAYDDEVEALGGNVYRIPGYRNLLLYGARLRRLLRGYDAVHSHVYAFSGLIVRWAEQAGVRQRIVHMHTRRRADEQAPLPRRLYLELMKRLIRRHATDWLACSADAGLGLYGEGWDECERCRIVPNAIDLTAFTAPVQNNIMREQLGIPTGTHVLGHVGRFVPEKNHPFLIDLLDELLRRGRHCHLVLVGDGPKRPVLERRVLQRGLQERVHFLGVRRDVPALMRGLFDLILFPSLWEGLGIVLIEAQAAGLPCLASSRIPDEAVFIVPLVRRMPLELGSDAWVEEIEQMLQQGRMPVEEALSLVKASGYDPRETAKTMEAIYRTRQSR